MIESQLKLLGYSDKEATIFRLLFEYGPTPASVLARLSHIKRTSIYDILHSLLEKKVITSFIQGKYTYFAIDDLNKLFLQEKEKLSIAENLVKSLKANPTQKSPVLIHYYVGAEGYIQMYKDILDACPEEILVAIHLDNFYKILDPVFEDNWTKSRVKKKIYARLIMQKTPLAESFQRIDQLNFRETRLVSPEKFPFETTMFLYKDTVMLFDSEGKINGIRIDHSGFSQLFKTLFSLSWELSKNRDNKI